MINGSITRLNYDDLNNKIGQYNMRKTRNNAGNTIRDILSISRHIIRSTPVSASVQATESIDWRRIGFGCPPLP